MKPVMAAIVMAWATAASAHNPPTVFCTGTTLEHGLGEANRRSFSLTAGANDPFNGSVHENVGVPLTLSVIVEPGGDSFAKDAWLVTTTLAADTNGAGARSPLYRSVPFHQELNTRIGDVEVHVQCIAPALP